MMEMWFLKFMLLFLKNIVFLLAPNYVLTLLELEPFNSQPEDSELMTKTHVEWKKLMTKKKKTKLTLKITQPGSLKRF